MNSINFTTMKIALLGYGKMGKAIEEYALAAGHTVALKIQSANAAECTVDTLSACDVALEFSHAGAAVKNILTCFDAGIPVVCGSTGWLTEMSFIEETCKAKKGCFFYASNFSIGVHLFFHLNKQLAQLMASYPEYAVSMKEIHHTGKKDAPSGTALSLAKDIIQINPHLKDNHQGVNPIRIISERIDPTPGTHSVLYHSPIDDIEITHTAHSRKGFALGALRAAEFVIEKKGIFSMQDLLRI